jgi:ribosomal protein L11 methyltransferase
MLLEWLEEDIRGGETVLDVGTGSGLLVMAALRFGAARAMGIDHDPVAMRCAREDARQNCFGDKLSFHHGELGGGRSFDLVLANLDGPTLRELAERLTSCTRSKLLASGVLAEQREEVVEALATAGLYPGRQRQQEGWLAMEFLPAQSCEGI